MMYKYNTSDKYVSQYILLLIKKILSTVELNVPRDKICESF